jgi:hypothetical protein
MKKTLSLAGYVLAFLLLMMFFSCKKQNNSDTGDCGCTILPGPILFEIVDKNGNNIIHSANDTLVVTYVSNVPNGFGVSNRLNIFKIQVSQTDTALSKVYNGFVISDYTWQYNLGYMSANSGTLHQSITNTYQFYLNGKSIGNVYFDFWGAAKIIATATVPYNTIKDTGFTLNGTPATWGLIPSGFLVAGYPAILTTSFLLSFNDVDLQKDPNIPNSGGGLYVYVLQYNE